MGGRRAVFVLNGADGTEFLQQLRLGGIKLAAVIAEIEFGQVQTEGAHLDQQALNATARGPMRLRKATAERAASRRGRTRAATEPIDPTWRSSGTTNQSLP